MTKEQKNANDNLTWATKLATHIGRYFNEMILTAAVRNTGSPVAHHVHRWGRSMSPILRRPRESIASTTDFFVDAGNLLGSMYHMYRRVSSFRLRGSVHLSVRIGST